MSETVSTSQSVNRGPLYAGAMALVWFALHIYALFAFNIAAQPILALALGVSLTWLYVGLFIVAHDAIHETLFGRGNPWNARIGRTIHFLYAGFNFDKMKAAHIDHHEYSGTDKDPDFNAGDPKRFWPWYMKFFLTYFGWGQIAILAAMSVVYLLLGAPYLNIVLMWAVPAILSSLQLFYFGTYRTHRHADAFPDEHNARSNSYPKWLSLLTCFHFGYHHEHHLYPHEPWWRLPTRRAESKS